MNYLIADSGSTKTSWAYIDEDGKRTDFETQGINPVRDNEEQIENILSGVSTPHTPLSTLHHVFFYGAGCIPPYSDTLRDLLLHRFPKTEISVESDLLGAAHALCGCSEGIVCILGTGSNSCLYDGERIVDNVSPLGWILGDEGSGAVLGRLLVGDVLKEQFSPALCQAFLKETGLTRTDIINKVYREPMPNTFLASLVPFLSRHREEAEVRAFLVDNFRRFFRRNVAHYQRPDLPVSFVGGIADGFCSELEEASRMEGLRIGKVLKRPIDGMVDYILKYKYK